MSSAVRASGFRAGLTVFSVISSSNLSLSCAFAFICHPCPLSVNPDPCLRPVRGSNRASSVNAFVFVISLLCKESRREVHSPCHETKSPSTIESPDVSARPETIGRAARRPAAGLTISNAWHVSTDTRRPTWGQLSRAAHLTGCGGKHP